MSKELLIISIGNQLNREHRDITGHTIIFTAVLKLLNGKDYTPGELASATSNDGSSISTLISRMEKHDLVQRKHSEKDRRVVHISITKTGKLLLKKMADSIEEFETLRDSALVTVLDENMLIAAKQFLDTTFKSE